jgi:hypothetical protein
MNPSVDAEPFSFTVSVPAVRWKKVGTVKSASKKHPAALVHICVVVGILNCCPPMLRVYARVNAPIGPTFVSKIKSLGKVLWKDVPAKVVVSIGNCPGISCSSFAPPCCEAKVLMLVANAGVPNSKAASIQRVTGFLSARFMPRVEGKYTVESLGIDRRCTIVCTSG